MKTSDIGLIGLAVMGENLALNMESKGFTVSVYNRTAPGEEGVVDRFMSGRGKGKNFIGTHTIQEFVESIERPRKIMLMVKAGAPVDELMAQLIPYLSPGDVIIDGGNSDFHDTERRVKEMEAHGITNPYRDVINNDSIYLVDDNIDLTLKYIRQYYDSSAQAVFIKTIGNVDVYQIRSK